MPAKQRGEERNPDLFHPPGKRRQGEANAESPKGSLHGTSETQVIHLSQKRQQREKAPSSGGSAFRTR